MPLYITEYAYLGKDIDGNVSSVPGGTHINHTAYAITTAARNSVTFRGRFVGVIAHTASVIAIGAAPDVSAGNGSLLPANVERLFAVDANTLLNFKMFV